MILAQKLSYTSLPGKCVSPVWGIYKLETGSGPAYSEAACVHSTRVKVFLGRTSYYIGVLK